jgi:hypothetical protein
MPAFRSDVGSQSWDIRYCVSLILYIIMISNESCFFLICATAVMCILLTVERQTWSDKLDFFQRFNHSFLCVSTRVFSTRADLSDGICPPSAVRSSKLIFLRLTIHEVTKLHYTVTTNCGLPSKWAFARQRFAYFCFHSSTELLPIGLLYSKTSAYQTLLEHADTNYAAVEVRPSE